MWVRFLSIEQQSPASNTLAGDCCIKLFFGKLTISNPVLSRLHFL